MAAVPATLAPNCYSGPCPLSNSTPSKCGSPCACPTGESNMEPTPWTCNNGLSSPWAYKRSHLFSSMGNALLLMCESRILGDLFCRSSAATEDRHSATSTTPTQWMNMNSRVSRLCSCERMRIIRSLHRTIAHSAVPLSQVPGNLSAAQWWSRGPVDCISSRTSVPPAVLPPRSILLLRDLLRGRCAVLMERVAGDPCGDRCMLLDSRPLVQLLRDCEYWLRLFLVATMALSPDAADQLRRAGDARPRLQPKLEFSRQLNQDPTQGSKFFDILWAESEAMGNDGSKTHRTSSSTVLGRGFEDSVLPDSSLRSKLHLQNFMKIQQVGQGAYGDVWLGSDLLSRSCVAMKRMKNTQQQNQRPVVSSFLMRQRCIGGQLVVAQGSTEDREGFPKSAIREIHILNELSDCPHIVKLLGVVHSRPPPGERIQRGSVWMIFEFLPFDLLGFLDAIRNPREKREKYHKPHNWLSMGEIKGIMMQLLLALHHCHAKNVVHRDVKSANLLMDADGNVKLADFGLARKFSRFVCHDSRSYRSNQKRTRDTSGVILRAQNRECRLVETRTVGGAWIGNFEVTKRRRLPSETRVLSVDHRRERLHRSSRSNAPMSGVYERTMASIAGGTCSFTRLAGSEFRHLTNRVITLWYRPPELLLGCETYDMSVDMWSAGCIMAELICACPLFAADKEPALLKQIAEKLGPPTNADLTHLRMLAPQHSWLRQLKHCGLGAAGVYAEGSTRGVTRPNCLPFHVGVDRSRDIRRIIVQKNQAGYEGWDLLSRLLAWNSAKRVTAQEALNHRWFYTHPLPIRVQRRRHLLGAHSFLTKARRAGGAGHNKQLKIKRPHEILKHVAADTVRLEAWRRVVEERNAKLSGLRRWFSSLGSVQKEVLIPGEPQYRSQEVTEVLQIHRRSQRNCFSHHPWQRMRTGLDDPDESRVESVFSGMQCKPLVNHYCGVTADLNCALPPELSKQEVRTNCGSISGCRMKVVNLTSLSMQRVEDVRPTFVSNSTTAQLQKADGDVDVFMKSARSCSIERVSREIRDTPSTGRRNVRVTSFRRGRSAGNEEDDNRRNIATVNLMQSNSAERISSVTARIGTCTSASSTQPMELYARGLSDKCRAQRLRKYSVQVSVNDRGEQHTRPPCRRTCTDNINNENAVESKDSPAKYSPSSPYPSVSVPLSETPPSRGGRCNADCIKLGESRGTTDVERRLMTEGLTENRVVVGIREKTDIIERTNENTSEGTKRVDSTKISPLALHAKGSSTSVEAKGMDGNKGAVDNDKGNARWGGCWAVRDRKAPLFDRSYKVAERDDETRQDAASKAQHIVGRRGAVSTSVLRGVAAVNSLTAHLRGSGRSFSVQLHSIMKDRESELINLRKSSNRSSSSGSSCKTGTDDMILSRTPKSSREDQRPGNRTDESHPRFESSTAVKGASQKDTSEGSGTYLMCNHQERSYDHSGHAASMRELSMIHPSAPLTSETFPYRCERSRSRSPTGRNRMNMQQSVAGDTHLSHGLCGRYDRQVNRPAEINWKRPRLPSQDFEGQRESECNSLSGQGRNHHRHHLQHDSWELDVTSSAEFDTNECRQYHTVFKYKR